MPRFLAAAFVSAAVLASHASPAPVPPAAATWMTCDWVEDKGGDCVGGEAPHPFDYYLHPETWDKRHFDLPAGDYEKLRAEPREIGRLGTYAIRSVRYFLGESPTGDVLLAERVPGRFVPLMWWAAKIDPPILYRPNGVQVLAMSRDFGGDVPTVETWAWVWGPDGIARLNVRGAKEAAIGRVAPGYTGYDTAMDWEKLQLTTHLWQGDWPGKASVTATLNAWFEIRGVQLSVKRVVFEENGKQIVWP